MDALDRESFDIHADFFGRTRRVRVIRRHTLV